MFHAPTGRIKSEVVSLLSKVQVRAETDVEAVEARRRRNAQLALVHSHHRGRRHVDQRRKALHLREGRGEKRC